MLHTRRTWIAVALGVVAFLLYAADLMGLKPPPRILPSVVLAIAAVLIGVTPRRADVSRPAAEADDAPAHHMSTAGRVMTVAGFVLLVLLLIPIVPIGLVAPGQGVIAIHGIWLVGFIAAWRLRRSNPPAVLAAPFVAAALIAATLWTGTVHLGWRP
jgi:hypothetical protein